MESFSDFITGIGFVIDIGWSTIAGLGFMFNRSGLDIVILILSIEGIGTRASNASILIL